MQKVGNVQMQMLLKLYLNASAFDPKSGYTCPHSTRLQLPPEIPPPHTHTHTHKWCHLAKTSPVILSYIIIKSYIEEGHWIMEFPKSFAVFLMPFLTQIE